MGGADLAAGRNGSWMCDCGWVCGCRMCLCVVSGGVLDRLPVVLKLASRNAGEVRYLGAWPKDLVSWFQVVLVSKAACVCMLVRVIACCMAGVIRWVMSVAVVLWIAEMMRCVSRVCCCVWVVGTIVVGGVVVLGGGVAFLGLCDA